MFFLDLGLNIVAPPSTLPIPLPLIPSVPLLFPPSFFQSFLTPSSYLWFAWDLLPDEVRAQIWNWVWGPFELRSNFSSNDSKDLKNFWRQNFLKLAWLFAIFFLSRIVDESADAISKAISVFCSGPALKNLQPDVGNVFYFSCGNAQITTWAFRGSKKCSFFHQIRFLFWNFACDIASVFYVFEQTPKIRGKFGEFYFVALVETFRPYSIFILVISGFNFFVMGRVFKSADEGVAVIYHRFEIGCDFALALTSCSNSKIDQNWPN